MSRTWLWPTLVAAAVLAAFSPVLRNGFVEFDDSLALLNNPHYRGLGWEQLRWAFGHFWGVHYFPLTWLSFGFDYAVWGMRPGGYHMTSLLLHALNGVLFYRLCLRLIEDPPSAAFAALVFALHPLRVESVAWTVQRSDVLSGAFYLTAALAYLDGRLRAAAGFFLAGLLSKATGVCLPLVLIVLDVYPLRRLPADPRLWARPGLRPVWREKLPFFALSAAAGLLGVFAHQPGTAASLAEVGWPSRLAQALYGMAFYLRKTLLPYGFLPLHEAPPDLASALVLSFGFLAVAAALLYSARRRWPAAPAAGLCYALLLLPSLGLFKFGPQFAGDRYSYLPCLPWAALAGAGLAALLARAPARRGAVLLGAALLTSVLGRLSWSQSRVWRDDVSLWGAAIAAEPRNYHAHNYLGLALQRRGAYDEAGEHFRASVEIAPGHAPARNNLANFLLHHGRLKESIEHYQEALRLSRGHPVARRNLERALEAQRRAPR